MANPDVTKTELYYTLYELNASLSQAALHCRTLQQNYTTKAAKLFPDFVRELQAEINAEFLSPLHAAEMADWARFGKVRQRWEKYLRGKPSKKR